MAFALAGYGRPAEQKRGRPVAIVAISVPTITGQVAELAAEIKTSMRIAELKRSTILRDDKEVPQAQQILAGIKQARAAGYSDEEIYNFLAQKFRGFLQIRELKGRGYRIAKNDGQTLTGLERALSNDAMTVQPDAAEVVAEDAAQVVAPDAADLVASDDLRRIAISDMGTYSGPQ